MLKMTQQDFEALPLDEKLLWLFRETQNGVLFDNRLSERISATTQQIAGLEGRLKKVEQDK